MTTNLTLDEMILQYSENPFVDEKMYSMPEFSEPKQKHGILNKLLLIASNIISSKEPEERFTSYKRRYSHQ